MGVGILAICAVWMVLNQFSSKEVKMATVKRGLIQDALQLTGQIDVAQKEIVCSKYQGTVKQLRVAEGRLVSASEELLRLNLADYQNSLEKAEAAYQATQIKLATLQERMIPTQVKRAELQLMQAQATQEQARLSYGQAQTQLRQSQQLFDAGSVTANQLKEREGRVGLAHTVLTETVRQTVEAERNLTLVKKAMLPRELLTTEAQLKQLGLEVAQLRQTPGEAGVFAHNGGLILKKYITVGTTVRVGERLLELGNYQTAYIRAKVSAEQRAKVRSGQKVMISNPKLNGNFFSGIVGVCPSESAKETSSAQAPQTEMRVKYDNDQVIVNFGARMRLKIIIQEAEEALYVPASSVFNHFGQPYVYVVEVGKAILRPVQTGIANTEVVEIKKGLFLGEQVVVRPGFDLRSGMKVTESQEL
jgi:HlyD family secretion protein